MSGLIWYRRNFDDKKAMRVTTLSTKDAACDYFCDLDLGLSAHGLTSDWGHSKLDSSH